MKDIYIEDKLCTFIKDFCDDLSTLQLLLFFSRHPNAHFNRSALVHALTTKQFDTGIALKQLIEKKVVTSSTENGISLYALTKDEPARSLTIQMVSIDQSQWQTILGHILDIQDIQ
ncbi:MAG TPA: hypothetical protein VF318_04155 [Dehalococcoidales bacterium]